MVRILEFVVNKQRLIKKRGCDFSHIVAGSVGYLHAKFEFSTSDWDGCKKAASFWVDGREVSARLLDDNNMCLIPSDILTNKTFEISVTGAKEKYKIDTSKIKIKQEVN